MLSTQSAREYMLHEAWEHVGLFMFDIEPTNTAGHGLVLGATLKEAEIEFDKLWPGMLGLNTKIERAKTSHHPSYGTHRLILSGDLYAKTGSTR